MAPGLYDRAGAVRWSPELYDDAGAVRWSRDCMMTPAGVTTGAQLGQWFVFESGRDVKRNENETA
jgi:hypothetical protein